MAEQSAAMKSWAKLSPVARQSISLVALFGVIAGGAALLFDDKKSDSPAAEKKKEVKEVNLMTPTRADTSQEATAAQLAALQSDNSKQSEAIAANAAKQRALEEAQQAEREAKAKAEVANNAEVVQLIAKLSAEVEELKAGKAAAVKSEVPSLGDSLPTPGKSENKPGFAFEVAPVAEPVKRKHGALRVSASKDKPSDAPVNIEEVRRPYLTSGSMFEGVLITGMDAPTSGVTQKNPVPSLMRIKTDATMPNLYSLGVKECFVMISGFGVMATERAQLRTESISCIGPDGKVMESKLDGYVVGEDGKAGLRGRLVSKQGAILAKSMTAGFLSGLGTAMSPSTVPQLNIAPGASQQFQGPNIGNAAQTGAYKGVADSAKMISQFYLEMAKEMFPVVEIDAGRRATIVVIKGLELGNE